jgi:hypothetical protein
MLWHYHADSVQAIQTTSKFSLPSYIMFNSFYVTCVTHVMLHDISLILWYMMFRSCNNLQVHWVSLGLLSTLGSRNLKLLVVSSL